MLDEKKNRGELRPYLANVNVRWGGFDLTDLRDMRFEDGELEKYGLSFGDIVMCEGGEPGRCALWKSQVPGMMIQKALHRIRPLADFDHLFLYHRLSFMAKSGRLEGLFTGSTIKHLPREKLLKAIIEVPPTSLTHEFDARAAPLEAQKHTLEEAILRASQARDLLLPRLMSGDIAV
jgi:type I restriction enzyme S subunit